MATIYVKSGAAGAADGSTWADAYTTLLAAVAVATAADTIWVSHAHSESPGTTALYTFPSSPGLKVLCGNDGAEPPTALATTAVVGATPVNGVGLRFQQFAYIYGIKFTSGGGTSGSNVIEICFSTTPHGQVFESCTFSLTGTSTSAQIRLGCSATTTNDDIEGTLSNCSATFGNAGQGFGLRNGRSYISNLTLIAGTAPTSLLTPFASSTVDLTMRNSDLTGLTWTNLCDNSAAASGEIIVASCKIPASIVVSTGTIAGPGSPIIRMENCDSADTNYRIAHIYYSGSIISETTLIKTSGASDGTTGLAWKMASNANAKFPYPSLVSPTIFSVWNSTTGSSVTVTVDILHDSVTDLKDDEVWLEVDYLGTSGFPKGSRASDAVASVIATAAGQDSSAATWTTTGMSNPNTQKLVVTVTPQEVGVLTGRVMLAKASYEILVDPVLQLS